MSLLFVTTPRPVFLSLQGLQMLLVQPIRQGDIDVVPAVIPRLVAPDQQDGDPPGIKGIEHPVRMARVLDHELSHVRIGRPADRTAVWPPECRAVRPKQPDTDRDGVLFLGREAIPPCFELVRVLDLPFH